MINKTLSEKSIKQKTDEMAFMWMLHKAIFVDDSEDITNILNYWFKLAFGFEAENDFYGIDVIDGIRKQLLLNAGMKYPVLQDTGLWIRIKESIIFED